MILYFKEKFVEAIDLLSLNINILKKCGLEKKSTECSEMILGVKSDVWIFL